MNQIMYEKEKFLHSIAIYLNLCQRNKRL